MRAVRGKQRSMIRFVHLVITVRDCAQSREWYTENFGFLVEIDIPERHTVGLKDDGDFTVFLAERPGDEVAVSCARSKSPMSKRSTGNSRREERAPEKLFWGYGAERRDPDGYRIYLWNERSMHEKGEVEI